VTGGGLQQTGKGLHTYGSVKGRKNLRREALLERNFSYAKKGEGGEMSRA